MNPQIASNAEIFKPMLWLDGTDEQEDELDDVAKGKLQPDGGGKGTVPGGVFESNKGNVGLETEDEEDGPNRPQ